MSVLAGLTLLVGPESSLGPRERMALLGLRSTTPAAPGGPVLTVALEPRGAATAATEEGPAGPAHVAWSRQRLLLRHAAF